MKVSELIDDFKIFVSNEERDLLRSMNSIKNIEDYNERERFIIENLIRKSLVMKIKQNDSYMVARNE